MIERVTIIIIVATAAALLARTLWRSWTRRDGCACGADRSRCPLSGSAECERGSKPGCPLADRRLEGIESTTCRDVKMVGR